MRNLAKDADLFGLDKLCTRLLDPAAQVLGRAPTQVVLLGYSRLLPFEALVSGEVRLETRGERRLARSAALCLFGETLPPLLLIRNVSIQ